MPLYYRKSDLLSPPFPDRADLELPYDKHIYAVTQSLFKLHPDFDQTLNAILIQDPKAAIYMVAGQRPSQKELVVARLSEALGPNIDRIHFFPRLSQREFLGFCASADVVLDPPQFSGGLSTIEAFSVGTPVVTLPGEFMRSRVTGYYYHQMEISDATAETIVDYIELAISVAGNSDHRRSLSEKISNRFDLLLENHDSVGDLAEYLLSV